MICQMKDPIQGGPFAMLDNLREPLVPLAPCTSRLEEVLKLRGLHVFGPASDFSGK